MFLAAFAGIASGSGVAAVNLAFTRGRRARLGLAEPSLVDRSTVRRRAPLTSHREKETTMRYLVLLKAATTPDARRRPS